MKRSTASPAPRPAAKISQQRIARDVDVSQALVSMVLNGRTEGISKQSQHRIWSHAAQLGYQPKGLRAASPGDEAKRIHIGFILRSGLALQERGINTVFLGTENKLNETSFRSTLETRQTLLDIVAMGEVAPSFLNGIRRHSPRVVTVSISYPGQCHSVQSNENQSLNLLVNHLAELGHRRFAWFGGNRNLVRHDKRYRAFRAALKTRDLAFDESWAFPADLGIAAVDATRICTEEAPVHHRRERRPPSNGPKNR